MRRAVVHSALLNALAFGCFSIPGSAQVAPEDNRSAYRLSATRIANHSIELDGRLDEKAWSTITPLTQFVERDPVEGGKPKDNLEVRIAFDDDAMWIATRVTLDTPRWIQAPVSRRDNIRQAEYILVSLDTYHDRRTAYSFAVSASGVRGDWFHPSDDNLRPDASFDPVWSAAAHIDSSGWTAEMRIPFTQLRFNPALEQTWGINVEHWTPSLNEDVYWIPVPKKEQGWASRFGLLTGITGIHPSHRIEVLPFAATRAARNGDRDRRNPFDNGKNITSRFGGDLKGGIGPGMTLEGTLNPDFGQVEGDPAEVNLSAYETFFPEKRPFFVEGAQLLKGLGADYFYSRRIGERPRGAAAGSYVDYPPATTILGAAKLTGRLANGVSVGVLAAATDAASARTFDTTTQKMSVVTVAPEARYGIARVQKQFGPLGSTVGLSLTGVDRSIERGSPIAAVFANQAYGGGADLNLRFAGGAYNLQAFIGGSYVSGDTLAIGALQRSNVRYYQRPDAKSFRFDSRRTSLAGYTGNVSLFKVSGKHWLYSLNGAVKSPGLELNDLGRLATSDAISGFAGLVYRELKPSRILRDYSASLTQFSEWNYDRDPQQSYQAINLVGTFPNFWTANLIVLHNERTFDERLTRGGPQMGRLASNTAQLIMSSSNAGTTRTTLRFSYFRDDAGAPTGRVWGGVTIRPRPRWQLSIDPNYSRGRDSRQYVGTFSNGSSSTYGKRYVFAGIERSTFLTDFRLNYTLRPDLTLETFAEPFAASGRYSHFGELPESRSFSIRTYGEDRTSIRTNGDGTHTVTDSSRLSSSGLPTTFLIATRDFNVRSFKSNTVIRWEYRPGSTLYIVWQQNRSAQTALGDPVTLHDLFGGLSSVARNVFVIKASYWIPAK